MLTIPSIFKATAIKVIEAHVKVCIIFCFADDEDKYLNFAYVFHCGKTFQHEIET